MRIGLVGAGRIGAPRRDPGRPAGTSSRRDRRRRPGRARAVADEVGARGRRDRVDDAVRRRPRRRSSSPPRPTRTPTDPRGRGRRHPDLLREAGRAGHRRNPRGRWTTWPAHRRPGAGRLPAPLRRRLRRRARGRRGRRRSAGCTPSGPAPSTRPRRPPATSPAPAASSATARSTTSTSSAGSPAARSSRSTPTGANRGEAFFARGRRRRHRRRRCSPSTTARSPSAPPPATTAPATTCGWRCSARRTRLVGRPRRRARRCVRPSRASLPGRARRYAASWTGSGAAYVAELHRLHRGRGRRQADSPCTGRGRARGRSASPRPATLPRAEHRRSVTIDGGDRVIRDRRCARSPGASARCPAGATSCDAGPGARRDARRSGLAATEFGPDGFLPADPRTSAPTLLADTACGAVGGFVPVVLHDPATTRCPTCGARSTGSAPAPRPWCSPRPPARTATTTGPTLDRRGLARRCSANLDRLAAHAAEPRRARHPAPARRHDGRAPGRGRPGARRARAIAAVPGHRAPAGRRHRPGRARPRARRTAIAHVHLKDVDAALAARVRVGRARLHRRRARRACTGRSGQGDVDIAGDRRLARGGRLRRLVRPGAGHHPRPREPAGRRARCADVRASLDVPATRPAMSARDAASIRRSI